MQIYYFSPERRVRAGQKAKRWTGRGKETRKQPAGDCPPAGCRLNYRLILFHIALLHLNAINIDVEVFVRQTVVLILPRLIVHLEPEAIGI